MSYHVLYPPCKYFLQILGNINKKAFVMLDSEGMGGQGFPYWGKKSAHPPFLEKFPQIVSILINGKFPLPNNNLHIIKTSFSGNCYLKC